MTGGLLKTHHDRLLDHLRSHSTVELYDSYMGMDQYLLIPFLVGWTSINPAILMFTRGTRFWHTAICSPPFQLVPQLTTNDEFTGASPGAHAGHGAEDRQYGLQVQCRGAGWDFSWANETGIVEFTLW